MFKAFLLFGISPVNIPADIRQVGFRKQFQLFLQGERFLVSCVFLYTHFSPFIPSYIVYYWAILNNTLSGVV